MEQYLKILLLEDNPLDAEMIRRQLLQEKWIFELRLAINKRTFLQALEEFTPDLVISDHSLPQFNSSKALELSREKFPDIPFIMVTGTVSEEFAAGIIKQGADDYILKDRLLRLPSAIEGALRQRAMNREKMEADRQLILSEEKYRTIFMKSPLPAWIYDLETLAFMDVNDAAIRHYGYNRDEFLQMTIRDIRPPETVVSMLEDIKKITGAEDTRQGIWTHLKKNGDALVAETTAHSLYFNKRNARMVIVNDVTERLKVQQDLRQSEENYRMIMQRVSDGFVAIDKDWNYTYVNKEGGEILGRTPVSLIGKNIWNEFPEGIDQPFYHAYYRAMATQQYIHLEEYYPPFDVWLENHIYPSPEGLSIFFRNITEQKKAAQKIIQSEENLKAIFDNTSEAFILLDTGGIIKAFNNRAEKTVLINGDLPIEVGKSIFEYVAGDRKEYFQLIIQRVLNGETVSYDRSYFQQTGGFTWIHFSYNPVWKNEKIIGLCITGVDITIQKTAEQQKEFDHNNLHALINNTDDLIWSIDIDFNLITSNNAFNKLVKKRTGRTPVRGTNVLSEIYNGLQVNEFKQYVERAINGESFTVLEFNKNPVASWSEISFYPIYEKQQVIGTACFSHDITERKKAEAELRRLEEEQLRIRMEEQKKITLAMLHAQEKERQDIGMELHDNVNQILVGTNLLLSSALSNPPNIQELIKSSMAHLQEAIRENRKIAHIFVAPDLDTSSLPSLLKKLIDNMLTSAGISTSFHIEKYLDDSLDSDHKLHVYRIAQEQCTNIIKYAKASSVNITLLCQAGYFRMLIADNGIGMDKNTSVSGIGLRNINNRLSLFNGSVDIQTSPGQGFSMTIEFPL